MQAELGIFHVISAFCDTSVLQNAEIIRKIPSSKDADWMHQWQISCCIPINSVVCWCSCIALDVAQVASLTDDVTKEDEGEECSGDGEAEGGGWVALVHVSAGTDRCRCPCIAHSFLFRFRHKRTLTASQPEHCNTTTQLSDQIQIQNLLFCDGKVWNPTVSLKAVPS